MAGRMTGSEAAFDAEYEALPAAVKMAVTKREYAWMDPEQRVRIQDDLCMPDVGED
jgi:hypothetical protein